MKYIISNNFIIPKYNKKGVFLRQNLSFKVRNRPFKKNIIDLLNKYWINFGINFQKKCLNLNNLFYCKKLPIILEIGFGNGENIFYNTIHNIQYNILGIEVYISGISNLFKKIQLLNKKIHNLKIIAHNAIEVLEFMICDNSIHIIQIFFPDPWPKKSHHKRRMIQILFLKLISKKLIYYGILHIITDCSIYAKNIIKNINNIKYFINISNVSYDVMIPNLIKLTKFGKKSILNKNKVFNLIFQCIK